MESDALDILIVDDDADIRAIAGMALELDPMIRTTAVATGAAALTILKLSASLPDLVLLDVMMPDIDGRTLIGEIRRLPRCADVPIVFLTAMAYRREADLLWTLQPAGILTKPFDPLQLADQVRDCLSRR